MVILQAGSFISADEFWNSIRVTIWFLLTPLTKVFLACLLIKSTVLLGTLKTLKMDLYPYPDLCLATILSHRSAELTRLYCSHAVWIMGYYMRAHTQTHTPLHKWKISVLDFNKLAWISKNMLTQNYNFKIKSTSN